MMNVNQFPQVVILSEFVRSFSIAFELYYIRIFERLIEFEEVLSGRKDLSFSFLGFRVGEKLRIPSNYGHNPIYISGHSCESLSNCASVAHHFPIGCQPDQIAVHRQRSS